MPLFLNQKNNQVEETEILISILNINKMTLKEHITLLEDPPF